MARSAGQRGITTASEPASGMEVLYSGEDHPSAIAVDDRYIYWVSLAGLRRAPLAGGEPVTLATGQSLRAMLPVGEDVFFLESASVSGSVQRVAREGGEVVRLAAGNAPSDLAVLGDHLFWSDPGNSIQTGKLLRMTLSGSEPVVLASELASPSHVRLDGGYVYYASSGQSCSLGSEGLSCIGGGIHRVPSDGGPPELVLEEDAVSNVVFNERGLYWLAVSPPRVMFAAREGTAREVANILNEGETLAPLRSDPAALYWASHDGVLRLPFDTEQVSRLASGLDYASDVAPRGNWVYVAESGGGRILRVATNGSANSPSGPISGPCPTPLGSLAELALTPRQDPNLELLALSLEPDQVTASQATYDRLAADVAAIRALAPELADIDYRGRYDGRSLGLGLSDIGAQSLAAGEYSAWDCLNQVYGLRSQQTTHSFGDTWVSLELDGTYNVPLLAELYAQLPAVVAASADGFVGDGSTLCVARAGERYQYVVDRASGDCPAGCTEHEAHHFESDVAGQITELHTWSSGSEPAAPGWFGELCR